MANGLLVLPDVVKAVIMPDRSDYNPPSRVAARIEEVWRQHVEDGGSSRIGPALGMREFKYYCETGLLEIHIETGTYKDYRGTSLDPVSRELFSDNCWFRALCVGGLVQTSDGFWVFGRRPMDAHQSPGKIDMPMGHPVEADLYDLRTLVKLKVAQELGCEDIEFHHLEPLAFIREDPIGGFDMVYYVVVKSSREDLSHDVPEEGTHHKERFFLPTTQNAVNEFLRRACSTNPEEWLLCSPPLVPSLRTWGRRYFDEGQSWYEEASPPA